MKLLAKRKNVYVVEDKGKVKTILNDKYNEVKLEHYNGERIFYDFGNGLKVQETYDERIFNCYKNDVIINIRDGGKIAEFILDKNATGYSEYFTAHYYQQHKSEFMDKIIESYGDRVVKIEDGYIVDDLFKVNNQGSSYFFSEIDKGRWDNQEQVRVHGEHAKGKEGNWHFLCTVAQGKFLKMSIDSDIGALELDETTMTIIAKINFLLNPNTNDSVFMNQLPESLRKILRAEKDEKDEGILI